MKRQRFCLAADDGVDQLLHIRSIVEFVWDRHVQEQDPILLAHFPEVGGAPETLMYSDSPDWFAARARGMHPEELVLASTLATLVIPHGGRVLAEEQLHAAVSPPDYAFSETVVVSTDAEHAHQLLAQIPADDRVECEPDSLDQLFVLCTNDGAPLAMSGWRLFHEVVADIRVVVPRSNRNHSLGAYAVAVAMTEAYDLGLVPQARVQVGNAPALQLANKLGFHLLGTVSAAYPGGNGQP